MTNLVRIWALVILVFADACVDEAGQACIKPPKLRKVSENDTNTGHGSVRVEVDSQENETETMLGQSSKVLVRRTQAMTDILQNDYEQNEESATESGRVEVDSEENKIETMLEQSSKVLVRRTQAQTEEQNEESASESGSVQEKVHKSEEQNGEAASESGSVQEKVHKSEPKMANMIESHKYARRESGPGAGADIGMIAKESSFIEAAVESTVELKSEAKAQTQMGTGNFRVCGGIFVCAAFAWIFIKMKACLWGENSCWYWSCCAGVRKATGQDKYGDASLDLTVHTARLYDKNIKATRYMVSVVPRRHDAMPKSPSLEKTATTGMSSDGSWFEDLHVPVAQGYGFVQVALFSAPSGFTGKIKKKMGAGFTCIGFAQLPLEKILGGKTFTKEKFILQADKNHEAGEIILTVSGKLKNAVKSKSGLSSETNNSTEGSDVESTEEVENADPIQKKEAELDRCGEELAGELEVADRWGKYNKRYFVVKKKSNGAYTWCYYHDPKSKRPSGTKPEGMVPFILISSVSIVTQKKSISEFAVQYSGPTGAKELMMLRRINRQRDSWIKCINQMVQYTREYRKLKKGAHGAINYIAQKATEEMSSGDDKTPKPSAGLGLKMNFPAHAPARHSHIASRHRESAIASATASAEPHAEPDTRPSISASEWGTERRASAIASAVASAVASASASAPASPERGNSTDEEKLRLTRLNSSDSSSDLGLY